MNEVISGSDIYWITRLDATRTFLMFALHGFAALTFGALFFGTMLSGTPVDRNDETKGKSSIRFGLRMIPVSIVVGMLLALTPTTKEACAILVIPAVANNQDVQALGKDVVVLAREWMEELRPTKGE